MFIRSIMLAMAAFIFAGCAATTVPQNNGTFAESTLTFEQEFEQVKRPFVIVYGEYGEKLLFNRKDPTNPVEYSNLMIAFMEPGFVTFIGKRDKEMGFDVQLQNLFAREGYKLIGTREHGVGNGLYQMNFSKNGKIVLVN